MRIPFAFLAAPAASDTLLDVDFTALALGGHSAASFLTATGLTFARSTGSTVQTSDSALVSGLGTDVACIGNRTSDDTKRGLVIQHNAQNILGSGSNNASPRDITNSWSAGSGSTNTYPYADSPDGSGTGCSRCNVTSGGYNPYGNVSSATRRTFSAWLRSKDSATNGDMQMGWHDSVAGDFKATAATASNTWARFSIAKNDASAAHTYINTIDARDCSGVGGQTARARDNLVDYIQHEPGDFVTEAIPTGNTRRSCDILSYSSASGLCDEGRFEFYAKFSPKHASTMGVLYDGSGGSGTAAGWYLWSTSSGSDYAYIKDSDKKLYLKVNSGTEISSTNAISWSQYDVVEVEIHAGANVASLARYRRNGGPWNNLVLATVSASMAPSGALTFFSNAAGSATADSGALPSWVHRLTITRDSVLDFDFANEPLSLYVTDFAGAPWNGTASASTSGSFNLVVGDAPSVGANFGTHPSADFDGTADCLHGSGTLGDAIDDAAFYVAAVASVDTYTAASGGAEYNEDAIFTDSSGALGLNVTSSGALLYMYGETSGKVVTSYVTLPSAGTKFFIEGWYDGTNIYVAVNGTASAGVAVEPMAAASLASTPYVAKNYDASAFLDGKIALLIARKTVPDAPTRAAYLAKVQADYDVP
jgi:hypothetical protein